MDGNTVSAERVIAAPAPRIFALLSDAAAHPSFDGSGTVRALRGTSEPLRLGSRFGMSMKQGLPYTTVNTVVMFEPDEVIAWQTTGLGGLIGGRIWKYELVPVEGGTHVRETWDIGQDKQRVFLRRGQMPRSTRKAMQATLDRIAGLVESPA
ncbi:SRPBCC family protein [Aeromicrobium sp. YIM 150415]|uniref:SRPBCC family protein n=1 Tax=Aeromicrobium sp. YIM 150415 TaxID=2803912 RepID=UPI001963362A|nr:SRPBCC family protein [Aeromicrobium sp. YIM 150415]MBM9464796.1 SRPBCC family protein [Aeromicrobium sp. YIM 150415]